MNYVSFEDLVGKTLVRIDPIEDAYENEAIEFETDNGEVYIMTHYQDCCESVYIEDINGDLNDAIGTPIIVAEERSEEMPDNEDGAWTFYTIRTIKGTVTIRWNGSSNGYYSIHVSFDKKEKK